MKNTTDKLRRKAPFAPLGEGSLSYFVYVFSRGGVRSRDVSRQKSELTHPSPRRGSELLPLDEVIRVLTFVNGIVANRGEVKLLIMLFNFRLMLLKERFNRIIKTTSELL